MSSKLPANLEWVEAEDVSLQSYCQIDPFSWDRCYLWTEEAMGGDHHKFNFIRLLDQNITALEFKKLIAEQRDYFHSHSRSLHLKISDSVFPKKPSFLSKFETMGTPLVSMLIKTSELPLPKLDEAISIIKCQTLEELEQFIQVNANSRSWPLDIGIYKNMRETFILHGDKEQYLLFFNGQPACTTSIGYFNDKFNSNLAGTHKTFQRRGLFNYMKLWLAHEINKDFYVQLNQDEESFNYYSKLPAASIVNTEYTYACD